MSTRGPSAEAVASDWKSQSGWLLAVIGRGAILTGLPVALGVLVSLLLEADELEPDVAGLLTFMAYSVLPLWLLQLGTVVYKIRAERGAETVGSWLPRASRQLRVLTGKGVAVFAVGLGLVAGALSVGWAHFGGVACVGLGLLYALVSWGVLLSALPHAGTAPGAPEGNRVFCEWVPALVRDGQSVEEHLVVDRVLVPPGFRLHVEQPLPARFETEIRHVVGAGFTKRRLRLARPLRRAPRGEHHFDPPDVFFSDWLGTVRIPIVQRQGACLKVLSRLWPVALQRLPRAATRGEGALTALNRQPTEDYTQFRDYAAGDDTRRIHWKLSVKVGTLQVRQPENAPLSPGRLQLVLDTFLPPNEEEPLWILDDVLDQLAELWISLGKALADRGEEVTLVLPGKDGAETLRLARGLLPRGLDLAARAVWQRSTDIASAVTFADARPIVVSARWTAPPADLRADCSWVHVDGSKLVADRVDGVWPRLRSLLLLPFPGGSPENGVMPALRRRVALFRLSRRHRRLAESLSRGAKAAIEQLQGQREPSYRAERKGTRYVLEAM